MYHFQLIESLEHWIDEPRTAGAIILRVSYGYKVEETDDPFIKISDKAMEEFSLSASPGAFLVDIFPACNQVVSSVSKTLTKVLICSAPHPILVSRSWLPEDSKGPGDHC
jgi:hypothetical protein